ncbi:MAG: serine hydrolase [Erythrobacter sp.]|uniref:serine hydrolase domain-containing protein n=1 Tax=Erythrobacter sp. TaxID=1042 RepID=UPI0032660289
MKKLIAALSLIGTIAISITSVSMASSAQTPIEPPLGLWSWSVETNEGSVSLNVEKVGQQWQATVGSEAAHVEYNQGTISVVQTDGSKFVGELSADRSQLRGYWYQPALEAHYQYVATPAVLSAAVPGRWSAEVAIQPRPFHVFLDIFAGEDAQIHAVIRNPEGNEILGATRFRLIAGDDGDGWILVAGSGDRELRRDLVQMSSGELVLEHDSIGRAITLVPATGAAADKYYSRPISDGPVHPTSPPLQDGSWQVASPAEAGFDPAALADLTRELASADPRDRRPQMIHSLLIARGGKLVFEEYFFGHNSETRHDVRSLGKVFGSVMIGALQQQGHAIDATHRPILDLFENSGETITETQKADITLAHLMTFTSGLDCNESSESVGSESRMWEQQDEGNYWLYTARLAMQHDPGARFAYCSGSANLVGASLRSFGQKPVHELFGELIAQPLDFGSYHWPLAPNGEGYLGGGAYVRPRDILKIGAMFAANGVWNGEQIIDPEWVEESTSPKIEISPETTGLSAEEFGNNYAGGQQAYIWRTDTIEVGERSYASYEASGNGGQLLIIVPELDLVVGFTGGNYRMGGIWGRWSDRIVGGHIIPAMIGTN